MSLGERIRTVFRLFALFTVLVAVAMLSAITTIRLTIHGRQATVPNLAGVPMSDAERVLGSVGLDINVEDKLFSTKFAADQIISQLPPPGTTMKMGQHVDVLVSLGPPEVTVPDMVGDSIRAAQISAVQRGLTVGDVARAYWTGTPGDQIVAQDPPNNTNEVHSPTVNLLVSMGDAPAAFLCPDFVGQRIANARLAIGKAGLSVGQVTLVPAGTASDGIILSQSPPAGSKIDSSTAFDFQVAQQSATTPPGQAGQNPRP